MKGIDTAKLPPEPLTAPYSELYIYYLKGHLGSSTGRLADEYIGNWEEDDFSFLFFSKPCLDKVERLLATHPQLSLVDTYQMSYADWLGEVPAPFQAGGLVVAPPWTADDPLVKSTGEERLIRLDPGVVFGTGTHPTTRDCLAAIERVFNSEIPANVLDLGTGTGLLSLAAAKLGALKIVAVDINRLAAETAGRNIRLNRCEDRILVVQGRAEDFVDRPSDLIMANIHYDVMKHIVTAGGFLSARWFILSGLLRSQAKDIEHYLAQLPVCIHERWQYDGIWYTFMGEIHRQV